MTTAVVWLPQYIEGKIYFTYKLYKLYKLIVWTYFLAFPPTLKSFIFLLPPTLMTDTLIFLLNWQSYPPGNLIKFPMSYSTRSFILHHYPVKRIQRFLYHAYSSYWISHSVQIAAKLAGLQKPKIKLKTSSFFNVFQYHLWPEISSQCNLCYNWRAQTTNKLYCNLKIKSD